MKTAFFVAALGFCAVLQADNPTADHLQNELGNLKISVHATPVPADQVALLAQNQLELCMIGDSVTWAGEGDYFRHHFLRELPHLAFIGTHTAALGYSHAGEGGNRTADVLKRICDTTRIPDAPYYHLLIGINDCAAAKTDGQIQPVAQKTFDQIMAIVEKLLERQATQKVFLGTILPGPFSPNGPQGQTLRDQTGAAVNALIRDGLPKRFSAARVVLIDYEKPLRNPAENWRSKMNGAHPTPAGYARLAAIAAPILKREMTRTSTDFPSSAVPGVQVVNLWNAEQKQSAPLVPGWYILSFDIVKNAARLSVHLKSQNTSQPKLVFSKKMNCRQESGTRVELMFMTGYEWYSYMISPLILEVADGEIGRIQIEKMRPSGKASIYGAGTFVDSRSPIFFGEKLLPAPQRKQR